MKKCIKCGEQKEEVDYHLSGKQPCKRCNTCKKCRSLYFKARRVENREQLGERERFSYLKNREKILKRQRACLACHTVLEADKELTKQTFLRLRGEEVV